MDSKSVKSILYQILSGLDHIHTHQFFHRDIKPENILVSTSVSNDSSSAFSRYSALVTPPSTPPTYSVKIADFGLAREAHSKLPYTTYVSTRWYRAPEVLLRAGEYSAPVDIWALGAMAVEVATLKPLFPGGNEVDQVWRICEIMGSPGNWYSKSGARVGGGDWREGTRLAQKLGFSFPKVGINHLETLGIFLLTSKHRWHLTQLRPFFNPPSGQWHLATLSLGALCGIQETDLPRGKHLTMNSSRTPSTPCGQSRLPRDYLGESNQISASNQPRIRRRLRPQHQSLPGFAGP